MTRRYWATFGLLTTQLICEVFDLFMVGFLVAAVAPKWHLTFGQTTVILVSAGVGAMVGGLGFGWVSDRFGRKGAIVGGGILYSLSAGAVALLPDGAWVLFALLRFLTGIGYGGAGSSQFALIAEMTPTKYRTLMTSSLGIPASLGVVFAATAVAALYPLLGWRGLAALGAAPILVAFAIAVVSPESPRWLATNGQGERARQVLRSMAGALAEAIPVAEVARPVKFADLVSNQRRFWLIVLVQFGMGTALTGVLLWGPTVVAQLLQLPPQRTAQVFVGVSLAGLVGRFLFVYLPMKVGRVRSGWLIGYGGALFLCLAALFDTTVLAGVPLFLVFLILAELFVDGGYSNINPYAAELYPVRIAALGTGVAAASGGLSKFTGPMALGLIAGLNNLVNPAATIQAVQPAFLFLAGCCLLAGLAYSLLGMETHGRPLAQE